MPGYALIMPMKQNLCAAISNPPVISSQERIVEATVPRRSPCSNQMRMQPQLRDGGGPGGEKGISWVVATTPTNPTTIKISRANDGRKQAKRQYRSGVVFTQRTWKSVCRDMGNAEILFSSRCNARAYFLVHHKIKVVNVPHECYFKSQTKVF